MTTAIINQNGRTEKVEDFTKIEQVDAENSVRVFYDKTLARMPDPSLQGPTQDGMYYEDYPYAQIIAVKNDDDNDEGGDVIEMDY